MGNEVKPNILEVAPSLVESYMKSERRIIPDEYERLTRSGYYERYLAFYDRVVDSYCSYYGISDEERLSFFPNIVTLAQTMALSYGDFYHTAFFDGSLTITNMSQNYYRDFDVALEMLNKHYGVSEKVEEEGKQSYL